VVGDQPANRFGQVVGPGQLDLGVMAAMACAPVRSTVPRRSHPRPVRPLASASDRPVASEEDEMTADDRPAMTPATVVGVRAIPPPAASVAVNRIRARLRNVRQRMAPPPVRILESVLSMLEHRALVALCEAGVPDALTGPTTVPDLAARLAVDPGMLARLVHLGSTRGWVRLDRRGRLHPTTVTAFLRTDHPGGWRAWVDLAGGDDVVGAVARLSAGRSETDPFTAANGRAFFDWLAAHADRSDTFDRAMGAGARLHGLALDAALDWDGVGSVCDVGGGRGDLLAVLLERRTGLDGTVLDLPSVVAGAVVHERLRAVAGDAFEAVPGGFDLYLLVNVVHDWGDDQVVRLLRTVAAAMDRRGRLVVVESDGADWATNDLALYADLFMATLTGGGRERSADEIAGLAAAAWLRLDRTIRLASADLAHVLVPAT
jgi:hypothetical protein